MAAFRSNDMQTTRLHEKAALWRVNACVIARYTLVAGTAGYPRYPPRVSASRAVLYDQGLPQGAPSVEDAVCWAWKRTLVHSIAGSWSAMFSMMHQGLEGDARPGNRSRDSRPTTLASCKAMLHAPLDAIP